MLRVNEKSIYHRYATLSFLPLHTYTYFVYLKSVTESKYDLYIYIYIYISGYVSIYIHIYIYIYIYKY